MILISLTPSLNNSHSAFKRLACWYYMKKPAEQQMLECIIKCCIFVSNHSKYCAILVVDVAKGTCSNLTENLQR